MKDKVYEVEDITNDFFARELGKLGNRITELEAARAKDRDGFMALVGELAYTRGKLEACMQTVKKLSREETP